MKKLFLIIFITAGLLSCSSDSDRDLDDIEWGQYIYSDNEYVVAINAPQSGEITIYKNGKKEFEQFGEITFRVVVTNEYRYFGWIYEGLSLIVKQSSNSSFEATVEENILPLALPAKMKFKLDNRVLDADNDGILDSKQ